jgi:hypothetical protein
VNCILEGSGTRAPRCKTWELGEPRIFLLWRWRDRRRYELGLPWKGRLPWVFGFAQTAFETIYRWVHGRTRARKWTAWGEPPGPGPETKG